MQEVWDQFSRDEFFQFNVRWLSEVCRVVKPNGNILVFGTFHNIYLLGFILQNVLNRRILNSIVWFKPNAQPNITARTLTESTEQVIWAVNETPEKARKWTFNYWEAKELAGGKQMRNLWRDGPPVNLWEVPVVRQSEKRFGKHPAQKPEELTDRLILLASGQGDLVMDPFAGAGGVGVSARRYLRRYALIEKLPHFTQVARDRIADLEQGRWGKILQHMEVVGMTLTDIELRVLNSIPVPQADDLELAFAVPSYVEEGNDTRSQVADCLKYVGRQGPYYADAAMSLRLIAAKLARDSDGAERLHVTPIGRDYLDTAEDQKPFKRRFIVLRSPMMKYIGSQLGVTSNGSPVPYPVPDPMLDDSAVATVLQQWVPSRSTAQRRAHTLCEWLRRI
jgi:site-specific DNA-methyltransferase (adenine-specific)